MRSVRHVPPRRDWPLLPAKGDQQIDVAKHPAPGLVEDEVTQGSVSFDEAPLRPQGLPRGRRHPADDDIPHLPLGVAGHHVERFTAAQGRDILQRLG